MIYFVGDSSDCGARLQHFRSLHLGELFECEFGKLRYSGEVVTDVLKVRERPKLSCSICEGQGQTSWTPSCEEIVDSDSDSRMLAVSFVPLWLLHFDHLE